MRDINISNVLLSKRKEKGITQEALADYLGVTKASVSKWETAQSYPDITLLPHLATFFNISIDDLIGYLPQMTSADIKRTYQKLAHAFSIMPFDEVYNSCKELIRKYYSCFPLLLKMALLYINHHVLTEDLDTRKSMLVEAVSLCERIRRESDDAWLIKQANSYEALAYLFMHEPIMVLDRLDDSGHPILSDELTLVSAYQMLGESQKAKTNLQISMYQHLMSIMAFIPTYLQLVSDNQEKVDFVLSKLIGLSTLFNVNALNPNTMAQIHYTAATIYVAYGNQDKALDHLEHYTTACLSIKFPLKFTGDSFFDEIDEWLEKQALEEGAPRSEKVIKESALQGLTKSPAFIPLKENVRFKQCEMKLIKYLGGN